ncbi:MAG: orotate phosphoribosyltransferase [Alphaproteobacteria bacterium]|nr:orotate phosphoribosyltransferase [Alphaproteobacteria bacterium]
MTFDEVFEHFEATGALLNGHFILSSGLRSPQYLQCARVLMHPARAQAMGEALGDEIQARLGAGGVDLVVSPAMGGLIIGQETAKRLRVPHVFTERVDGKFVLRRGFEVPRGARVAIIEDVVTTGKSSRECAEVVEAEGGSVVVFGAIMDRTIEKIQLSAPFITLAAIKIPTYPADQLPPELAAIPATKPGSRGLK